MIGFSRKARSSYHKTKQVPRQSAGTFWAQCDAITLAIRLQNQEFWVPEKMGLKPCPSCFSVYYCRVAAEERNA